MRTMVRKFLKKRSSKIISISVSAIAIILIAGFIYSKHSHNAGTIGENQSSTQTVAEKDLYVRFVMEAYDGIVENYWMKAGEYDKHNSPELPELFQLAVKKAAVSTQTGAVIDRNSTAEMLARVFENATSTMIKQQLATEIVDIVTYNLLPIGRNSLFSEQQRVALRDRVSNIDPSKDLYRDLGVPGDASQAEIEKTYNAKVIELGKATSTTAKATLAQISYAKNVLTNSTSRALYDEKRIEPTIFSHIIENTLYLYIKQISPTTLFEFGNAISNASTSRTLDSMIIDLRGNVGGDLDFAGNFVGLFIGQNQYAYDLFRKEEYKPQRTMTSKLGELKRFKEIAILTDHRTQSTAELTTAIMKRLNLAKVVGNTTAGWGTIENTYPISSVIDPARRYTMFLVNHITLGEDNQPIEGNGVVPHIDASKADWKGQLAKYFTSPAFIKAVREKEVSAP